MSANAIPGNYPRVTPHLSVDGASAAIDYYTHVLGANERLRVSTNGGTHAEIEIGDSVIMVGDELSDGSDPSPTTLGGSPVALFVYVEDVDDAFERAIDGGGTKISEPADRFYGDRVAMFDDPFGHRWNIATHVEDVSPQEMERRATRLASDLLP